LESIPLERGFHLAEPRSRSKAASILDFDPIMPIECKRLPTPKAKDRDEREGEKYRMIADRPVHCAARAIAIVIPLFISTRAAFGACHSACNIGSYSSLMIKDRAGRQITG